MRKNLLLIPILIYLMHIVPPISGEYYDTLNFNGKRNSKFISFNTNSGKIEMALDLSLPFLSIPLGGKNDSSGILIPSLNVNSKTLAILGVLTVLSTVVPWLLKQKQLAQSSNFHHYSKEHKRTKRELELFIFEDPLNEILIQDNYVKACIQRTVCKTVAYSIRSYNSSNTQKKIDSLSSCTWFDKATSDAVIKEAVWKGRKVLEPNKCTTEFKECALMPSQEIIADILKIIEIL